MSYGDMTWRVSIAPQVAPNIFGNYIDVSDYVELNSLGTINIETEQTEFSVGIARTSSITLKLKNDSGRFSDENTSETIFTYKRAGSKVKISYFEGLEVARYGSAIYGDSVYGDQLDIYEGVISSETPRQNVQNDMISLSVVGVESIFDSIPYDGTELNTVQSLRFLFENLLNKPAILALANVNVANFTVGTDFILDNLDDFEDIDTIDEAISILLEVSNSILVVQDGEVYISDKEATAEVQYTFYGQASNFGIENIQNIQNDTDGLPRMYNLWRWDTDTLGESEPIPSPVKNQTTVDKYGVRKQIQGIKGITDGPTRTEILESFLDEYGTLKKELDLTAPANYQVVRLPMLSKVEIDYPAPQFPANGGDLPIWGTPTMVWGNFSWPYKLFQYEINTTTKFKIIGIKYSMKKDLVTFRLREV